MDKSARFWERIAKRYAKQAIADESAYQKKLTISRKYFHNQMNVLEVGCGTGGTALSHSPFVKHIRALDVSANMLSFANQKKKQMGITNVDFHQQNIVELDEPEHTYDTVLALSFLHLIENKEKIIANIYKFLKPGAVFVSSTPCIGENMKFFKFIAPVGLYLGVLPLLKVFDIEHLKAAIRSVGFEIDYCWLPSSSASIFLVAKKPL